MSGYCRNTPTPTLYGDTDHTSSIPSVQPCAGSNPRPRHDSSSLRAQLPDPAKKLSRAQLPDPAKKLSRAQLPDPAKHPSLALLPDPMVGPSRTQSIGSRRPPEIRQSDAVRNAACPKQCPIRRRSRRLPMASTGPVYLEGRLVLSLSFRLESPTGNNVPVPEGERLLERYCIWDDKANDWLDGGPTALRFESADVVLCTRPQPAIAWVGSLDVQCPIIDVPDLDERGWEINQRHRLRWRACTRR